MERCEPDARFLFLSMPLVTILLPVYNGMPFLPHALRSIMTQTLQGFSVLIVDGGSTDGSREFVKQFGDPRVALLESQKGLGTQLMFGLEQCSTEFVARMDADDLCTPDRLQRQLSFLQLNPSVGLVGTQYCHFTSNPSRSIGPPLPTEHSDIYKRLIEGRLALVHASMMCRTEVLRRAGGYRVTGSGEDWDMFLRVGEVAGLANLSETLYYWRLHKDSVTVRSTSDCILRIRFACEAARRRSLALPETSFDDFLSEQRGPVRNVLHQLDCYSLLQYRRGLYELLNANRLSGGARLAWSALCSPSRTTGWIRRYMGAKKFASAAAKTRPDAKANRIQ